MYKPFFVEQQLLFWRNEKSPEFSQDLIYTSFRPVNE